MWVLKLQPVEERIDRLEPFEMLLRWTILSSSRKLMLVRVPFTAILSRGSYSFSIYCVLLVKSKWLTSAADSYLLRDCDVMPLRSIGSCYFLFSLRGRAIESASTKQSTVSYSNLALFLSHFLTYLCIEMTFLIQFSCFLIYCRRLSRYTDLSCSKGARLLSTWLTRSKASSKFSTITRIALFLLILARS